MLTIIQNSKWNIDFTLVGQEFNIEEVLFKKKIASNFACVKFFKVDVLMYLLRKYNSTLPMRPENAALSFFWEREVGFDM